MLTKAYSQELGWDILNAIAKAIALDETVQVEFDEKGNGFYSEFDDEDGYKRVYLERPTDGQILRGVRYYLADKKGDWKAAQAILFELVR